MTPVPTLPLRRPCRALAARAAALALAAGLATPAAHAACTAGSPGANLAERTPTADFIDHGDGTATHLTTGLMWQRCAQGQTWSGTTCSGSPTAMDWAMALAAPVGQTFATHSDWRLPTVRELQSIAEICGNAPAINTAVFPASGFGVYWSATTITASPSGAWVVNIHHGNVSSYGKSVPFSVRLVRGGQSVDSFDVLSNDTHPTAFTFTDQTNVPTSDLRTSNTITVAGINTAANISITGGEYQIGSGGWTSSSGTVNNGETVTVRHTSSASYSSTVNTVLTIGGVADTFSSSTQAEPVAPPVEPPTPTEPSLPSGGGSLSLAAGSQLRILDSQSGGSTLTLLGTGQTRIVLNNVPLLLDTTGTTTLTVVRAADGSLGLQPTGGRMVVTGTQVQQVLVHLSGKPVLSGTSDSRLVCDFDNGMLQQLVVTRGSARLPTGALPGGGDSLWTGEVVQLGADGLVLRHYLGALAGDGLGDSLAGTPGLGFPVGVPRLAGVPERLRAGGQTSELDQLLASMLSVEGLRASRQDPSGVIHITDSLGHTFAALPVGRVAVLDAAQAGSVSANPDGGFRLNVGGFGIDLAPTVRDPRALADALAQLQAGTGVDVIEGGVWRLLQAGRPSLVFRPGWYQAAPAPQGAAPVPGFGVDAEGFFTYVDSAGYRSTLYPAPLDQAGLLQVVRAVDGSASLMVTADGRVLVTMGGVVYRLRPHYGFVAVPPSRSASPYWIEGGVLFVPVGSGLAQGFGLLP
jgi:hypothetical protein